MPSHKLIMYFYIVFKTRTEKIFQTFSKVMLKGYSTLDPRYWYEALKLFKGELRTMCSDSLLESPELVKIINEKRKVDAVVMLGTCASFLGHALDSPLITFSPAAPFSLHLTPGLGNPINPIIQPNVVAPFIEPLSFFERIANIFLHNLMEVYTTYVDSIHIESVREQFGAEVPDFYSIMAERSALAFTNSHFVTHGSWPYYQNLVEIGGIHCKPGKPLPSDLKEFMDSHPEGVVYVSFGSALKPSQMEESQKAVFRESFKELKDMPIIWKWDEDDLSGIPENVMVQKWLPQNDLLAHPNLKVFVTHGGLLSTQESLFHSIPLVGVPISNDQKPNLLRAERHGYAIMLSLQTMTKDELVSAIRKAMTDPGMRDSITKMHDLFTEYQEGESPAQRAVRAVDYIIKHKGAEFLKPRATMSMPWYQERGFDILAFVLLIASVFCFLVTKICCCCLTRCCYKKSKQD